jgi:dihydroorotase
MKKILLRNATLVNEGKIIQTDILITGEFISEIGKLTPTPDMEQIDCTGLHVFPGVIDGQVHFRDPGLTHKADLTSESRAAVAGGVTTYFDMPNTKPNVVNLEILQDKYHNAIGRSYANYCFLLGVTSENLDYIIQLDKSNLPAITDDGLYFTKKGNILADNPEVLEKLFENCPETIVAIHSEKEEIIEQNEELYRSTYGEDIPPSAHPLIRSEKACFEATERAIQLANKHNARLHILHLSTAAETVLFRNDIPLAEKRITCEVSVHHLWFCEEDYARLGHLIKWNPAIKTEKDREGLLKALQDDRIDFITTDHAPHTLEEKQQTYFNSMSGAPLIQHTLNCMLEFYHDGHLSLEKIAEKMCHNPAQFYQIKKRGFIRPGYYADLTMVDLSKSYTVSKNNLLYKCGWSPLEGTTFRSQIIRTMVNGVIAFDENRFTDYCPGMPIEKQSIG